MRTRVAYLLGAAARQKQNARRAVIYSLQRIPLRLPPRAAFHLGGSWKKNLPRVRATARPCLLHLASRTLRFPLHFLPPGGTALPAGVCLSPGQHWTGTYPTCMVLSRGTGRRAVMRLAHLYLQPGSGRAFPSSFLARTRGACARAPGGGLLDLITGAGPQ